MDVDAARAAINRVVNERWIILFPDDWDNWTTAPYAAGPFPARLVLDEDRSQVRNEVVAAHVAAGGGVLEALRAVPFPKPDVRQVLLGDAQAVMISYPMEFARTGAEQEVLGLFSAGLLFATELCRRLGDELSNGFAEHLARFEFDPDRGFPHDPRDFLRRPGIEPWPPVVD